MRTPDVTTTPPLPAKTTPRFPTIKSATGLIYRRLCIDKAGLPRIKPVIDAEMALYDIAFGLEKWSRNHKKLYGRKASVDDFLRSHTDEIHNALVALDKALTELERRSWTEKQLLFLRNYRLNLADAHALDFSHEGAGAENEPLSTTVAVDAWDLIDALDAALAAGALLSHPTEGSDLYGI